jgi:CheY-like chemotaxis protein
MTARHLAVLLVDDATDERQMYAELFRASGFRTLQADNAMDAQRLAIELRPDAAVIDLVLPGMNGLELVRKLRSDEGTSRLPIIALTGRVVPLGQEVASRWLRPISRETLLTERTAIGGQSTPRGGQIDDARPG